METSTPTHNPRLSRLTHALAAAHRATSATARRRAFALASRHARGQDVYLAPGEECCPFSGQPRTPNATGQTIRALINALRAGGTRITIPLLEEYYQARVRLRVRRDYVAGRCRGGRHVPDFVERACLYTWRRWHEQEAIRLIPLAKPTEEGLACGA